jgi:4-hydroxybenzoate polyprenyltransferase
VEPSKSFAPDLLAYASERLLTPRVLALVAAVAAGAALGSGARRLETTLPLAFLLVWAFRLWDDLEDLPFDRAHHPARTLVLSGAGHGFRAAAVAGLLACCAALAFVSGATAVLAFLGLVAALAAGYRLLRGARRRLLRAHCVLAKYPAFVALAAWQPVPERVVPAAALVYLVLCLIEIIDDPELRVMREARALAVAEGIAIAGIVIYGAKL